jgi:hypothetical protein
MRSTFPAHLTVLDLITLIIFRRKQQIMNLVITQFSLASCHFLHLKKGKAIPVTGREGP